MRQTRTRTDQRARAAPRIPRRTSRPRRPAPRTPGRRRPAASHTRCRTCRPVDSPLRSWYRSRSHSPPVVWPQAYRTTRALMQTPDEAGDPGDRPRRRGHQVRRPPDARPSRSARQGGTLPKVSGVRTPCRHHNYTGSARPSALARLRSRGQDFPSRMSRVRIPSPAPLPQCELLRAPEQVGRSAFRTPSPAGGLARTPARLGPASIPRLEPRAGPNLRSFRTPRRSRGRIDDVLAPCGLGGVRSVPMNSTRQEKAVAERRSLRGCERGLEPNSGSAA